MRPELSIVMPCLNESRTLAACIKKAQLFLKEYDVSGEVIIADNGSTDGSIEIAEKMNARVVRASTRGYGAALATGIEAAKGKYIIMGDSDESYDFSALAPHLRWYGDGWSSLRFYLLMSPRWFVGIPGLALLAGGMIISTVLLAGPISVMSIKFDYHTLIYSASAILLGYQSVLLFIFAK